MKILLCINTLTMVDAQVYSNHFAWAYHLGCQAKEKNLEVIFYTPWRVSIDRARNTAAKLALENECDYLMFVDDDMLLQMDTLEKLLDADKDIVMAHTYIRGYPFEPMSFKNVGDGNDLVLKHYSDLMEHTDEKGLVDCAAIGFATVLIRTSLLKRLEPPYFVTTPNSTEDVYFCIRCKMEIGPEVSIACDTRVPTAHALDKEFVHEKTVKYLREYFKNYHTENSEGRKDRGQAYHEMIEGL